MSDPHGGPDSSGQEYTQPPSRPAHRCIGRDPYPPKSQSALAVLKSVLFTNHGVRSASAVLNQPSETGRYLAHVTQAPSQQQMESTDHSIQNVKSTHFRQKLTSYVSHKAADSYQQAPTRAILQTGLNSSVAEDGLLADTIKAESEIIDNCIQPGRKSSTKDESNRFETKPGPGDPCHHEQPNESNPNLCQGCNNNGVMLRLKLQDGDMHSLFCEFDVAYPYSFIHANTVENMSLPCRPLPKTKRHHLHLTKRGAIKAKRYSTIYIESNEDKALTVELNVLILEEGYPLTHLWLGRKAAVKLKLIGTTREVDPGYGWELLRIGCTGLTSP